MSALLGAAALLPAGLAAQGIPVTVGVGAIESGAGAFDLPITIDMSARTEKLGSFVLTLRWNPAVLQLAGGVSGSFGDVTVNEDSAAAGVIRMTGANPAGVSGLVTLAVGRFAVLANDTTTFRISVQELYAAGTFADLTTSAVPIDRLFCGSLAGTWGDVNRDGAVNGADALIVLTESVGLDVSQYAIGFGDVDSSGVRNPRDALIILSYAVGIGTAPFRVGQSVGGSVCSPPGAQSYGINPAVAEALPGQEVVYYAFGLDSTGAALALRNVTWTSSNGAVASVDAGGYATALAAGTTTITALQNDTAIASGTLTVTTTRRTHWVDALAVGARNQLGSAAHPFEDIGAGTAAAAAGDTVRVRPGRYDPFTVMRPMVVLGDSAPDGSLPVIDAPGVPNAHGTIADAPGGTVELRRLRYGTMYAGIEIGTVGTMLIRDVELAPGADAYGGIGASDVGVLRLERSVLVGQPSTVYTSAFGLWVQSADSVIVDSTVVSDFPGDGIRIDSAGVVVVQASELRNNGDAGLSISTLDTAWAAELVFSRNRVAQNASYGVYASYVRRAEFDHNAFVSDGSAYYGYGVYLDGTPAASVSFLADSIDVVWSDWLYVSQFDSLLVDSVDVRGGGYGGAAYGGRIVVLQDGRFRIDDYDGFYVSGLGTDQTTVLVRNHRFDGSRASYSGYGIEVQNALVDIEGSSFADLYYGAASYYGTLAVRQSQFTDSYYGIYGYCFEGPLTVDSVRIEGSYEGLYAYACGTPGVVVQVDSLDVSRSGQGVDLQSFQRVQVRQSRLTDVDGGIYVYATDTVRVDTVEIAAVYGALDFDTDSVISAIGNTLDCGAGSDGIYVYGVGRRTTVQGNVVTGSCDDAVLVAGTGDTAEVRGNTITAGGTRGIMAYTSTAGSHVSIAGNTVSGAFGDGSIRVGSGSFVANTFRVDSNVVTGGVEAGIRVYTGDTVRVRDNTITGIGSLPGWLTYEGGIVVEPYALARGVLDIRRNRVAEAPMGIVINRGSSDTVVPALVDSNRVVGVAQDGIRVLGWARVLAERNVIDSVGRDAVHVDRSVTGDTTVRIRGNNLLDVYGSTRYAVYSADAGTIDATGNWWGDALGPSGAAGDPGSTGDSVSSGVDWSQPLRAPAGNILPPSPPAFGAFAAIATSTSRLRATRTSVSPSRPAPLLARDRPEPPPGGLAQASPETRARFERQLAEWRVRQAARVARHEEEARRATERTARRQRHEEERR